MEDLLEKIYRSVVSNESDSVRMGEKYEVQINRLIERHKDKINEEEMEILKELMYDVGDITERGGFVLGVRFSIKLMLEILGGEY